MTWVALNGTVDKMSGSREFCTTPLVEQKIAHGGMIFHHENITDRGPLAAAHDGYI
jgi:hypothetical protein